VNGVNVKTSTIHKRGVFATRKFKKGEIVIAWHPQEITRAAFEALPETQRIYVEFDGDKILLLQEPERYVNHSCDPNTTIRNQADTATRDIDIGEEITSDYALTDAPALGFVCQCGSPQCRGLIPKKPES
jgi:SET domain-containing protein